MITMTMLVTHSFLLAFMFASTVSCVSQFRIDTKLLVSVKAVSTGCYSTPDSQPNSITINNQQYSQQLDGVNIVKIEQDGSIISENFLSEYDSFFSRRKLRRYLATIDTGTVVIIATQNLCRIRFRKWAFQSLTVYANISVGSPTTYTSKSRNGIIFGCRNFCTNHVVGSLFPMNNFSTSNNNIMMTATFGLKGYKQPPTDNGENNLHGETNSNKNTTIIILVVIILILIAIISICCAYLRCRKKCKATGDCKKRRICFGRKDIPKRCSETSTPVLDPNTEESVYADLNRRPSALPNIYEPLQKMSVQYEEINEIDEKFETKRRADTNLSILSASSLGTSQTIFHKVSTCDAPVSDFASYVQVDSTNVIYKAPSSVPKFDAPKTVPQNAHRESYMAMEYNDYQEAGVGTGGENVYAPLTAEGLGYSEQENTYSSLLPN